MESFKKNIGFSTGSLSFGNFRAALKMLEGKSTNAIELSALREWELPELFEALNDLSLEKYEYISFHAPSKLKNLSEQDLVALLYKIVDGYRFPVIVHPDILDDFSIWKKLGSFLCIENMDKRKPIGRTWKDLRTIFEHLPEASFCLDLAHVRQVDPTMVECFEMIKMHSFRLKQLHISDVTSDSLHVPINMEAIRAYRKIVNLIPNDIPIIIESPIEESNIDIEVKRVLSIFSKDHIENLSEDDELPVLYMK